MTVDSPRRCPRCGLLYLRPGTSPARAAERPPESMGTAERDLQLALAASRLEIDALRKSLEAYQFTARECAWAIATLHLVSRPVLSAAEADRVRRALMRVEDPTPW